MEITLDDPRVTRNWIGYINNGPFNEFVVRDTGNWIDDTAAIHDLSLDYRKPGYTKYITGGRASDIAYIKRIYHGIRTGKIPKREWPVGIIGMSLFAAKFLSPIRPQNMMEVDIYNGGTQVSIYQPKSLSKKRTRSEPLMIGWNNESFKNRKNEGDLPSNYMGVNESLLKVENTMKRRHVSKKKFRHKKRKTRAKIPAQLKPLADLVACSFPKRTGYSRWVYNHISAANLALYVTLGAAIPGASDYTYVFGSVQMLKAFSCYCEEDILANTVFNPSSFGRKVWIEQLRLKTTIRNPGNNPIKVKWFESKPTMFNTSYTPKDFGDAIAADALNINKTLASVRNPMTITDLDFNLRSYPGYDDWFKTTRSGEFVLNPEQTAIIWQQVKNRKVKTVGVGANQPFTQITKFLTVKFYGMLSNTGVATQTTLATNYIGYPIAQLDFEQDLLFKGRNYPDITTPGAAVGRIDTALIPNTLGTTYRYPQAVAPFRTFTEIAAAANAPVPT